MIHLKGKSLEEWESWLENELTPPLTDNVAKPLTKYTLEAFLELIKIVKEN